MSRGPLQVMLLAQVKCESVAPGEDLVTDVTFIFGHPPGLWVSSTARQLGYNSSLWGWSDQSRMWYSRANAPRALSWSGGSLSGMCDRSIHNPPWCSDKRCPRCGPLCASEDHVGSWICNKNMQIFIILWCFTLYLWTYLNHDPFCFFL